MTDLTAPCTGVQALGVAAFALLQRRVEEDLVERQCAFVVNLAGTLTLRRERRDQRDNRDGAGIGEQCRDFCCAPDVLAPIVVAEAEVGVEACLLYTSDAADE